MLSKITFLLPLKDRPHVTLRLVKYLMKINYKLNIIIADGSKIGQKKFFKIVKKKHNLIYLKYPYDKNVRFFTKKVFHSSKKIKTKYSCFMESDELVNFKSLITLIKFLDKNKEYVFVKAVIRNFNVMDNNNIQILDRLEVKQKRGHDFFSSKKLVKISGWEGIHRTKVFKKIFFTMEKNNISNINIFCDYLRLITQIHGKIKFNPNILYSFRQANTHFFDSDKDISANKKISFIHPSLITDIYKVLKLTKIANNNNLDKISTFKALIAYCFEFKILRIFKKILRILINRFSKKRINEQNIINLNNEEKNFFIKNKSFLKFTKKHKIKIYA